MYICTMMKNDKIILASNTNFTEYDLVDICPLLRYR